MSEFEPAALRRCGSSRHHVRAVGMVSLSVTKNGEPVEYRVRMKVTLVLND